MIFEPPRSRNMGVLTPDYPEREVRKCGNENEI
jgi:hypothetical protein